jgi:hypothetical protein
MFSRGTPASSSLRTIWKRQVDLPLRRTPMHTVALPGTIFIESRHGTSVSMGASWKSSRMAFKVSSLAGLLATIVSVNGLTGNNSAGPLK